MKKLLLIIFILISFFTFNLTLPAHAKKPVTSGKGIWINIWNYPGNPDMYCEYLKSKGIDIIYLQVFRSNTPGVKHPHLVDKIIESAHTRNIKVIGWGYVFLKNPLQDAEKFIHAARYKTPKGESLDAFAADIEEITNSQSIETFTKRIREELGNKYPLIAITFSPISKSKKVDPRYYSWRTIAENFDIIAPMTYWHGFVKYRSEKGAYDYTTQTIAKIKEYTKRDDLKIHLIGDGQKTSSSEIIGFLRAAQENNISAGVSLYPYYIPKEHQIDILGMFKF